MQQTLRTCNFFNKYKCPHPAITHSLKGCTCNVFAASFQSEVGVDAEVAAAFQTDVGVDGTMLRLCKTVAGSSHGILWIDLWVSLQCSCHYGNAAVEMHPANIASFLEVHFFNNPFSFLFKERPRSAVEQLCLAESTRPRMTVEEQMERIKKHQQACLKERKKGLNLIGISDLSPSQSPSFVRENALKLSQVCHTFSFISLTVNRQKLHQNESNAVGLFLRECTVVLHKDMKQALGTESLMSSWWRLPSYEGKEMSWYGAESLNTELLLLTLTSADLQCVRSKRLLVGF